MSRGARTTLAVATLFFGTIFLLAALTVANNLPAGPLPFYGLAAVCYLVATACLSKRSRVVTLLSLGVAGVVAVLLANPRLDVSAVVAASSVAGILAIVGLALYGYVRWKNRLWFRAARLAQQGNTDAGLALLHDHLERQGSSVQVYHNLAMLYFSKQHYGEALRMAEEAERLGGAQPEVLGTKGLILWKLGRVPEALTCLWTATHERPNDLMAACNYGSVLAESGRVTEAGEVLQRAEQLAEEQIVFGGAGARQARKEALESLQRKVAEAMEPS